LVVDSLVDFGAV